MYKYPSALNTSVFPSGDVFACLITFEINVSGATGVSNSTAFAIFIFVSHHVTISTLFRYRRPRRPALVACATEATTATMEGDGGDDVDDNVDDDKNEGNECGSAN